LVQSARTEAKRTLPLEGLTYPTAIDFLADRRQLIVVDGSRLLAAKPDGTAASLLTDQLMANTSSIAYAADTKTLYLASRSRRLISRFGFERRDLATFLADIGEVTSMSVNEDLLYWTEKAAEDLFWVKRGK
jgi:sugar lactone lactonase YvrE